MPPPFDDVWSGAFMDGASPVYYCLDLSARIPRSAAQMCGAPNGCAAGAPLGGHNGRRVTLTTPSRCHLRLLIANGRSGGSEPSGAPDPCAPWLDPPSPPMLAWDVFVRAVERIEGHA